MAKYVRNLDTRRVSDIEIRRGFDVICNEHGVIDSPPTYSDAIRVRRDHWFHHPDHRGETRPSAPVEETTTHG